MLLQIKSISRALCEFFELATHNILYRKGIYSKSMFVEHVICGVSVYQYVHPIYSKYIRKAFKAALFHLTNKTLERIMIGIIVNGIVIEEYKMIVYEINQHLMSGEDSLDYVFQEFYLKIGSCIKSINKNPQWTSFYINLGLTSDEVNPFDGEIKYTYPPWDTDDFYSKTSVDIPVHIYESDEIKLHLVFEKNADAKYA